MTADFPDSDSTAVLPLTHALLLPRIAIESTSPVLEGGQFAVKATVGQQVNVSSTVFVDGYDQLAVRLHWRKADHDAWRTTPMQYLGNDWWAGHFEVPEPGRYVFCIEAWVDHFASFCHELDNKHQAGVPVSLELQQGRVRVQHAIERSTGELQQQLQALLRELSGLLETEQVALFLHESSAQLMAQAQYHAYVSLSPEYPVEVERHLAAFANWYELFPRSVTDDPAGHDTFNDVHARLPMIHDMGFDVMALPAIHPINQHHRAGPDNSPQAGPDEPGKPSANGREESGQAVIHPQWGTRDDFRRLVAAAADPEVGLHGIRQRGGVLIQQPHHAGKPVVTLGQRWRRGVARALMLRVEQGLRIQCVWLRWARHAAGASVPKAAGGTPRQSHPQHQGIIDIREYALPALVHQALASCMSGSMYPPALLVPCHPFSTSERQPSSSRRKPGSMLSARALSGFRLSPE